MSSSVPQRSEGIHKTKWRPRVLSDISFQETATKKKKEKKSTVVDRCKSNPDVLVCRDDMWKLGSVERWSEEKKQMLYVSAMTYFPHLSAFFVFWGFPAVLIIVVFLPLVLRGAQFLGNGHQYHSFWCPNMDISLSQLSIQQVKHMSCSTAALPGEKTCRFIVGFNLLATLGEQSVRSVMNGVISQRSFHSNQAVCGI